MECVVSTGIFSNMYRIGLDCVFSTFKSIYNNFLRLSKFKIRMSASENSMAVWFGAISSIPNLSTPNMSTIPNIFSTWLKLLKGDNSVK